MPNPQSLLDFFVDCVLVAVRAVLFQLQPGGGVAPVLGGGVAGYARSALCGV